MAGRYSKKNKRFSDPHAPRFRAEAVDLLATTKPKFFSAMKKQHPELKKYSNSDIAKCIKLFNIRIGNEVVSNRNGVRLSEGLGIIVAGACRLPQDVIDKKVANTNIDHNMSEKLGVLVTHQNLHSDMYIAKVKYSNEIDRHMFDNYDLWMFDGCRNLTRAVAAEFKQGNHNNYIMFNTYEHIAHLFRKPKIERESGNTQVLKKQRLEEHDEFAF